MAYLFTIVYDSMASVNENNYVMKSILKSIKFCVEWDAARPLSLHIKVFAKLILVRYNQYIANPRPSAIMEHEHYKSNCKSTQDERLQMQNADKIVNNITTLMKKLKTIKLQMLNVKN